jgi:TonB family protein
MRALLEALVTVFLVTLPVSAQAPAPSNEPVYDSGGAYAAARHERGACELLVRRDARESLGGSIKLKCVVSSEGTTKDVEIVSGLEKVMDANAVAALKQWKFEPGQREGKPVAVRIASNSRSLSDESTDATSHATSSSPAS